LVVVIIMFNTVALTGAYNVFVNCIIKILTATDKVAAINVASMSVNIICIIQPIVALITWPLIALRGWDNGLVGTPKRSTHDAPNDPIRKIKSYLKWHV
jgi:hypothetical protein